MRAIKRVDSWRRCLLATFANALPVLIARYLVNELSCNCV